MLLIFLKFWWSIVYVFLFAIAVVGYYFCRKKYRSNKKTLLYMKKLALPALAAVMATGVANADVTVNFKQIPEGGKPVAVTV